MSVEDAATAGSRAGYRHCDLRYAQRYDCVFLSAGWAIESAQVVRGLLQRFRPERFQVVFFHFVFLFPFLVVPWDGLGLACLGMAWVGLRWVSAGWGCPRLGAHFIAVAADVLLRREQQGYGARNWKPTAW